MSKISLLEYLHLLILHLLCKPFAISAKRFQWEACDRILSGSDMQGGNWELTATETSPHWAGMRPSLGGKAALCHTCWSSTEPHVAWYHNFWCHTFPQRDKGSLYWLGNNFGYQHILWNRHFISCGFAHNSNLNQWVKQHRTVLQQIKTLKQKQLTYL